METKCPSLLIVSDSQEFGDLLVRHFDQLGYRVVMAKNGPQASEMLAPGEAKETLAQKFDMALVDIAELGVDSFQTLEHLKAVPALNDMPIIAFSTSEDASSMIKCLEIGAQAAISLKEKVSKMERDLEIGRQVQVDFLPKQLPQPPGWEIVAHFDPAREVAGDFYDVIPLPRHKIGLVVADVCDKGVGPALFMSLSRSLVRAFAAENRSLSWLDELIAQQPTSFDISAEERRMLFATGNSALLAVEFTNDYIAYNHGDMYMFATLFFGVLDPATGVLTYINAGHEPPFVISPTGSIKTRLAPTGPAVGLDYNANFDIQQLTLDPGDLVFIYSDGVPDARDSARKRFGRERLVSLLEQPAPSAAALLDRLNTNLRIHIGDVDQFDDVTLLAARRLPIVGG